MPLGHQFHPLEGIDRHGISDPSVRVLVGDGTPYLKAPGLKELHYIKLGPETVLPTSEEITFPLDTSFKNMQKVEDPLLAVERSSEGVPVILRSKRSNDGVWQKDAEFLVYGDWEVAKTREPKEEKQQKAA